jgi:hypothetical protein
MNRFYLIFSVHLNKEIYTKMDIYLHHQVEHCYLSFLTQVVRVEDFLFFAVLLAK